MSWPDASRTAALIPSSRDGAEFRPFLVIPAGGRGLRMGGGIPKQFREWKGRSLLRITLEAFLHPDMPQLAGVAIAVPPDRLEEVQGWTLPVPLWVVVGGETRQDSVAAALAALPDLPDAPVMIHDAVRPFPPAVPVHQALEALQAWDGAVLAEASTDTLKQVDDHGLVVATLPRERIFRAQTPQVASLGTWRESFAWAAERGFTGTDDVSLLEAAGLRVRIIESTAGNLKVTTPEDWERLG